MFFFLFDFLYANIIKNIINIIMTINNPSNILLIKTANIISVKYAINIQPIVAPKDIAMNIFQGLSPTNLPTIDPTSPPDP